ncbi:PQQ-dependent sugar dehydrogenase [Peribacillus glennii]|uniref:Sorbosone dehydrogenase family protein n=1 Tax=Peribacillus glennii TaxID=2303991 RepID=A0A372LC69_9BACI|nr:PQQ-dependent sugar dehydrogenase [Peribacillus glennii]RFU62523.1 sorbosone dehydrogenase family protein [Peribacillus glennii]
MKRYLILSFAMIIASGCSVNINKDQEKTSPQPAETSGQPAKQEQAEVLLTKLKVSWSIQKTGETIYLSERTGNIVKWDKGKMAREKVNLKKKLSANPEAGLLGFVLARDFKTTNQAFAYYTYDENGESLNRIVLLGYKDDQWTEEKVLLDGIPSGQYHHGGRLKIGPDGKLYATAGDAHQDEIAQDKSSLGGKILRLNLDGSIPGDNPFPNSYVYSLGHRNPQGLAWDEKGQLYSSEHGPSGHDELNKIITGHNYGWPLIIGDEKKNGMERPLFHSGTNTWAPSGIAFEKGIIYAAALRGEAVKGFDLGKREEFDVFTGAGRIRDVLIDGGYLYFVSNNTDGRGNPDQDDDKLYRLPLPAQ